MRGFVRGFWAVLGVLLAGSALADGMVILDFGGAQADDPNVLRVGADDSIRVQVASDSNCGLFGIGSDGTLAPTFGTQGRLSIGGCSPDFVVRPDNSMALISPGSLQLQRRDASGALIGTPTPIFPQTSFLRPAERLLLLADGKLMAGGFVRDCGVCPRYQFALARLNADGAVDTTFANGFLNQAGTLSAVRAFIQLPEGRVVAGGDTQLSRYTSTDVDFTFGVNAFVTVPLLQDIAADSNNRIYVGALNGTAIRVQADGSPDSAYVAGAASSQMGISSVAIDSNDRLWMFGIIGTPSSRSAYIARFSATGAPDTTFNGTGSVSFSFPGNVQVCRGVLQSLNRPLIACSVETETDAGYVGQRDLGLARFTAAGVLDTSFGAAQADSDTYPDAFSFANIGAAYGAAKVVSAPATITGFDAGHQTTVSVSGLPNSELSVGCNGTWTTSGYITAGQTLCVRQDASTTPGGTSTSNINVGGRHTSFTVNSSNTAADSIPDAFSFTPQTDLDPLAVVTSNTIVIQGITGYSTASITGAGAFSVGCAGPFVLSSVTITNGMTLCVRHQSSSQFSTATSTTLSVGGISATFMTTTRAADTTPDVFSFGAQIGTARDTVTTSPTITVSGIDSAAPITVANGEYSIGCGTYTSAPGTVANGQTVCVRHTSSANYSTGTVTTLTIGGVSGQFTTTTAAAPPPTEKNGGGGSLDGLLLGALFLFLVARQARRREVAVIRIQSQQTSEQIAP